MAILKRLFGLCAESERSAVPVDELFGVEAERRRSETDGSTRREFIARGASVGAAVAVAGTHTGGIARAIASRSSPRIAIVGAGLAGLRCAHALFTMGAGKPIAATIYEANPERAGGRCWIKGAYSYYRVGQASSYGALAKAPEGRFLFAGEHTSIANIGLLDGAVETGERAARSLLRRLR